MPRRHRNRHRSRTMKGGLFEGWFGSSTPSSSSGLLGSTDSSSGSWWDKTKKNLGMGSDTTASYGGKSRRRNRTIKGGFTGHTPTTGLAVKAAPFSGPTAQPHNWLGGKRSRKHRHSKSCRHRKH